ncbi:MAG: ABC transporter permease [Deltaproteobacteria bacterium]|nr:ABC transporter permease [Deltaproteobacteria bacterium]
MTFINNNDQVSEREIPHKKYMKKLRTAFRGVPLGALIILGMVIFLGFFGDIVAPCNPRAVNITARLASPWSHSTSGLHVLGTDQLGRDILSRILVGARVSLIVGLSAVFMAGTIGATLGILAGYFGGWVDGLIMRLTDMMFAIPVLVLALVLSAVIGPGFKNIVVILGMVGWTGYARLIRGEVLKIKDGQFVRYARVAGTPTALILARHIFPNVVNPLIVMATLQLGIMIIAEASLTFLGLGVQPPTPAWGSMVAGGRMFLSTAWWIAAFPGLAILLTVMSVNILGDWLRVRLDPKFRQI